MILSANSFSSTYEFLLYYYIPYILFPFEFLFCTYDFANYEENMKNRIKDVLLILKY